MLMTLDTPSDASKSNNDSTSNISETGSSSMSKHDENDSGSEMNVKAQEDFVYSLIRKNTIFQTFVEKRD